MVWKEHGTESGDTITTSFVTLRRPCLNLSTSYWYRLCLIYTPPQSLFMVQIPYSKLHYTCPLQNDGMIHAISSHSTVIGADSIPSHDVRWLPPCRSRISPGMNAVEAHYAPNPPGISRHGYLCDEPIKGKWEGHGR